MPEKICELCIAVTKLCIEIGCGGSDARLYREGGRRGSGVRGFEGVRTNLPSGQAKIILRHYLASQTLPFLCKFD